MKLPNPKESSPIDASSLYKSVIGDAQELAWSKLSRQVYNYDNKDEHLMLFVLKYPGGDEFSLLCVDTPCCGEIAIVENEMEGSDSQISSWLRCPACNLEFCIEDGEPGGHSNNSPNSLKMKQYTCFVERKRVYVLHPDKNIRLLPPEGHKYS